MRLKTGIQVQSAQDHELVQAVTDQLATQRAQIQAEIFARKQQKQVGTSPVPPEWTAHA